MILSALKKLPFWRNYTTKQWEHWWGNRKIDWDTAYLATWNHPHRFMITSVLKTFDWMSLLEIGCGAGANLMNLIQQGARKQLGGVDINADAIALAQKTFKGAHFRVGNIEDMMMSDSSSDVVLSDMTLIYVSPGKIHKVIGEMKRIARLRVVLSELHSESWWERLKMRARSGLNMYDYVKLLQRHGFYDVVRYKMPPESWPNGDKQIKFGYVITAKVPRRK